MEFSRRLWAIFPLWIPISISIVLFQNCNSAVKFDSVESRVAPNRSDSPLETTSARALTSKVLNYGPDSFIDYEISTFDENGFAQSFIGKPLLFDIDGVTSPFGWINIEQTYKYSIIDSGTEHPGGLVKTTEGSDLFGNIGPTWRHFKTDDLSFFTSSKKVIVRIYMMGSGQYPRNEDPNEPVVIDLPPKADFRLKTFLKVGNALPVTVEIDFVRSL